MVNSLRRVTHDCVVRDFKYIETFLHVFIAMLMIMYIRLVVPDLVYSASKEETSSGDSKAFASESLENIKEMIPQYLHNM